MLEIVDLRVHGAMVGEFEAGVGVVEYGAADDGHVRALLKVLVVRLGWWEVRQPERLRYSHLKYVSAITYLQEVHGMPT